MSLIGIFIVALIMSFAFSPYKRKDSVTPLVIFFFLLLLAGLAAQYWVLPFGPRLWGVAWLPVLIIMLIFGLLFTITPPKRKPRFKDKEQALETEEAVSAISIFVWIVLLVLLIIVALGMYHNSGTLMARTGTVTPA